MEQAVREYLKKSVPYDLIAKREVRRPNKFASSGYTTYHLNLVEPHGYDGVLNKFQVVQRGKKQEQFGFTYWPCKVYIEGVCTGVYWSMNSTEESSNFRGETEYNFAQDPYDKWYVRKY